MRKFMVYASEKVYYTKIIEADSKEVIQEMLDNDLIEFTNNDIVDGENFEIENTIDEFVLE